MVGSLRNSFGAIVLDMLLTLAIAASAHGGPIDTALSNKSMFGINRDSGMLYRYDFSTGRLSTVGTCSTAGVAVTSISSGGYFPGFQQLFCLRSTDTNTQMLYVDITSGKTTVVNNNVEGGKFTGACTVNTATVPYGLFGMQQAKIKPPSSITGSANINPNNSTQNEFTCQNGTTYTFTRDDLAANNITLSDDGTFYSGPATWVHLKPKGNGNQNGLIINGSAYPLQNSNTYDFNGTMTVRVWNDKISKGKAMGHWWISITGQVYINNEVQVLTPNRIAKVDQKTGTVNELVTVSRSYTGLASTDGVTFYTGYGSDLYKIDTSTGTAVETKVGTVNTSKISRLDFVDSYLFAYNNDTLTMFPVSTTSGSLLGSPMNPGMGSIGAWVFTPLTQDPTITAANYD
jgi:hypothetical protein